MIPCLIIGLTVGLVLSTAGGRDESNDGSVRVSEEISTETRGNLWGMRDEVPSNNPYRKMSDSERKEGFIDVWMVTLTPVATTPSIVEDVVLRPSPDTPMPLRSGNIESFDRLLDSVFGELYSSTAFSVADCEQGYKLSAGIDPYELNQTAVGDAGEVSLWQIHPIHFWKYDEARLQADIEYAAQAAWELSGYGTNWTGPWRYCGWQ